MENFVRVADARYLPHSGKHTLLKVAFPTAFTLALERCSLSSYSSSQPVAIILFQLRYFQPNTDVFELEEGFIEELNCDVFHWPRQRFASLND